MSLAFYMDEHVKRAVTNGLRLRGVDVLTAQEDGREGALDPQLLDRATELGRALFTQDDDLLAEASLRQAQGSPFSAVIYAHQLRITIGECVLDLELIAHTSSVDEMQSTVIHLPL